MRRINGANQGFTLIEVMMAAAIGAIVLLGMLSMSVYQNQQIRNSLTLVNRNDIKAVLDASIHGYNLEALKQSADAGNPAITNSADNVLWSGNRAFFACMDGLTPTDCTNTNGVNRGFYLLRYSQEKQEKVTIKDHAIAGPPNDPIYYKQDGSTCGNAATAVAKKLKIPSLDCPIKATATFEAICDITMGSPCDSAKTVTVTYTLETDPALKDPQGKLPPMKKIINMSAFNPATGGNEYVKRRGDDMYGDLTIHRGAKLLARSGVELFLDAPQPPMPYLDFHFGNTGADFDTRIINTAAQQLDFVTMTGGIITNRMRIDNSGLKVFGDAWVQGKVEARNIQAFSVTVGDMAPNWGGKNKAIMTVNFPKPFNVPPVVSCLASPSHWSQTGQPNVCHIKSVSTTAVVVQLDSTDQTWNIDGAKYFHFIAIEQTGTANAASIVFP